MSVAVWLVASRRQSDATELLGGISLHLNLHTSHTLLSHDGQTVQKKMVCVVRVCVCISVRKRASVCVCVCMFVCKRVCACLCERVGERVTTMWVCVGVCVRVCGVPPHLPA